MPLENSPLGVVHCEAGFQLERKVDILLTGCVPGNQDRKGQEGVCQFVIITLFHNQSGLAISENILDYNFLKLVRMMGIHYEGKATYLMSEEIVKIVI